MQLRVVLSFALGVTVTAGASPARATELELGLHGGGLTPAGSGNGLSRVGWIGGATALLRTSDALGFGLKFEHGELGWSAAGPEGTSVAGSNFPDDNGSMSTSVLLGVGRSYVMPGPAWTPFLQLGVGYGGFNQSPRHPDCSVSTGPSLQLGVGLDTTLSTWARLGGMLTAHPFGLSQSCNSIGYDGRAPDPPFPGLAVAAQIALTTLWESR